MHSSTARVYKLLGTAYKPEKSLDKAISYLQKSVEIMRAVDEKDVGDISATLMEIDKTYNQQGELQLAEGEVVSIEEDVWDFFDLSVRTPLGWQNFEMVKSALQKASVWCPISSYRSRMPMPSHQRLM